VNLAPGVELHAAVFVFFLIPLLSLRTHRNSRFSAGYVTDDERLTSYLAWGITWLSWRRWWRHVHAVCCKMMDCRRRNQCA